MNPRISRRGGLIDWVWGLRVSRRRVEVWGLIRVKRQDQETWLGFDLWRRGV